MSRTWIRLLNRAALAAAAIAVVAALIPTGQASAGIERPLCQVCRCYIDKSPCRAQAFLDYNGRTRTVEACSLFCLFEELEDLKGELKWIYVQNYDTRKDPEPLPLNADRSWFVFIEEEVEDALCQAPYTYAFNREDTAREFAEELGGEVLNWEAVSERVKAITDEWEPEKPAQKYGRNSYR